MAERKRTLGLTVRLDDAERRMLDELVEYTGLSASDHVRQSIRQRHAEVFGPPTPPRKRRRKRR